LKQEIVNNNKNNELQRMAKYTKEITIYTATYLHRSDNLSIYMQIFFIRSEGDIQSSIKNTIGLFSFS